MLNIRKVVKPWQEAGSLNANLNLYGFVADDVFLTKSGDLGMMLRCGGVDHESLDSDEQQYAVRRAGIGMESLRRRLPHLPVPAQDQPPRDPVRRL